MKKLFSFNVIIGTSVTPVVVNQTIDLDNNYNTITGIGIIKITGTDDEVRVLVQDDEKTIFNKAPLSSCYQINAENNKTNLLRICHIPIVNHNVSFTFTADSITTESNFDIVFMLSNSAEEHRPTKNYDFQSQRFFFVSGQTDWADGTIHGALFAKLKDTHDKITGVLICCPVAGRLAIKDGNNNYLVSRINKDFLEYSSSTELDERFYPILIENIRNLQFGLEFKPLAALEADTFIDVVFLLEKDLPHLNGLNGPKDIVTFTIKHPTINIDGKESEYFDKNGEFHMKQERIPGIEVRGTVFYNIKGELEFKDKKYYLFSHYLMPHVCMFEDEANYKLVGYQEWKKNDLKLSFYI